MMRARAQSPSVRPIFAVLLVAAIAWLLADLVPLIKVERHLACAATAIDENPVEGFAALEKGAAIDDLSRRQRERVKTLGKTALKRIVGRRRILTDVGSRAYDPAAPARPYVTANHEMMLAFELPKGLTELGVRIKVSSAGKPVSEVHMTPDGTRGRAEVPLEAGGKVLIDVDLECPLGAWGGLSVQIARGLELVQKSRGPSLRLWSGQRVDELREGVPFRLTVERGTALKVELLDELGVSNLQWRVDGVAHDPFDWAQEAETRVRFADLPADLTAAAAGSRELEFKASNALALPTRAVVELLVRDLRESPIGQVRLERDEVHDGAIVHVSDRALTLTVVMAKGELPADLEVLWDDVPSRTRESGPQASALLATETEGPRTLVLKVRGTPVFRCSVVFDWTPPSWCVVLDPGGLARKLEVRKASHDVPIGSIVQISISDASGVDRDQTEWKVDGSAFEEIPDPEPATRGSEAPNTWIRTYRCVQQGEVTVRLVGSDVSGNRTTIHEYKIRSADPMQGRTITLNGRAFPPGAVLHTSEKRFDVKTEGGIDVDGVNFLLLDPDRLHDPLGQTALERGSEPGTLTGSIDLGFLTASGRRIVGVLSRGGRELSKGEVVIDFAPPSFRVINLDEAGAQSGILRYFGSPGDNVSLTLTDDVGIDVSSVSALRGADIVKVSASGSDVAVVIRLPAVIEEPVVLSASDLAKNLAEFRFEVVPREEPESQPESRLVASSRSASEVGPAAPNPPPSLERLLANPKIVHPLLGTFLLVPVRDHGPVPPFYIGEREITVKDWRAFVRDQQSRTGPRRDELLLEAGKLLAQNKNVLLKDEDDPFAGATMELAKAYAAWANEVGRDLGVWKIPTAVQWKLAAGRATHPEAVYPTTGAFPAGNDLTDEGMGGALFGHDAMTGQEMAKRALSPGAYQIRAMPGSLYEWVIDSRRHFLLIGGSASSQKEACRLDATLRSGMEIADYERGLRLVLLPREK